VAVNHTKSVRFERSFSWMDAYPTPIAEILYFAISFRSLLSPLDDGEFERVKVLKSTMGGRTSDSYIQSAELHVLGQEILSNLPTKLGKCSIGFDIHTDCPIGTSKPEKHGSLDVLLWWGVSRTGKDVEMLVKLWVRGK
jgi:hypothetical protein